MSKDEIDFDKIEKDIEKDVNSDEFKLNSSFKTLKSINSNYFAIGVGNGGTHVSTCINKETLECLASYKSNEKCAEELAALSFISIFARISLLLKDCSDEGIDNITLMTSLLIKMFDKYEELKD